MSGTVTREAVSELVDVCGEQRVVVAPQGRLIRAMVPAPFPFHRWADEAPDVVVLPETTEEVVAIVKLANRLRIPIVPRAGATGLNDGAKPMRGGIVVDTKRMNRVLEVDTTDWTVTIQPSINMLKLNELLAPYGVWYPDDPASYPVSIVSGRVGTGGWSLLGSRYGHVRDNVISMEFVLPTGEVIEVGQGGGRKIRHSSTGYRLKDLFLGHQGTLGIVTECTLELYPRPEAEFPAFFGYPSFEDGYRAMQPFCRSNLATLAGVILFDERKVEYLRRDDEAYIPEPESLRSIVAVAAYGSEGEVAAARDRLMRIGAETGGRYLGEELSELDWASRHDRYATPLHGRSRGRAVHMSWHCEDAAITYSQLPMVKRRWHEIADRYVAEHEVFDNWGMFCYTNNAYKGWGDFLVEIDIGVWEQRFDERSWHAWTELKREIAQVSLDAGGSISACHGATREGEVDLIPVELKDGQFDLMLKLKRLLDPNNIMNPGKYLLDRAYEEAEHAD
jgi:glycolate oxidase